MELSEAAVSAGVKTATGEGFRQHLGRLRLTEAARLVKESQLQMTEIAFRVGFASAPHFNRQFRELWGCSPSEMRQNGSEKA
jgi:transcriptional regulator GlxA family with amidase domain